MALQDCTIYFQIHKHLIEKELSKMSNKKKIKKPRKTRETGKHNKDVIDGWRKVIEKM